LLRKFLSTRYRDSTIVEFVGSHCGPEGQVCRCRTLKPGKEPMRLLGNGGNIFKSVNRVSQARSPSDP